MKYLIVSIVSNDTNDKLYTYSTDSGSSYETVRDRMEKNGYRFVQSAFIGSDAEDADIQVVYYKKKEVE